MMNLPTIFVTLAAALSHAESAKDGRRFVPLNYTAAGLFNSATEKCCLGSVHPLKKPEFDRCCGSDVIDSSKQLCCSGTVLPLVPGETCCGQKTINTDNSICCNDVEITVAPEDELFLKCCGNRTHDTRKQTCCSIGDEKFVIEGEKKLCCGDKAFEPGKETCCPEYRDDVLAYTVLLTDGNKTTCCGDAVYDPASETCCNRQVVPKTSGCCANQVFDINTELCCADFTIGSDTPQTLIVKKTDRNQRACCGMEPYDTTKQTCCLPTKKIVAKSSSDHYQCCGDQSYGYQSGICCNDVLFSNATQRTHVCCGGKPIETSTNTYQVSRNSKLCCGGTEMYDSSSQLCCSEYFVNNKSLVFSIVPKTSKSMVCCGSKGYDSQKEVCCRQQIFPNSGKTRCCGSQSFDLDKEICCSGGSVFTKENGRDSCCYYSTSDNFPRYPISYPFRN